MLPVVPRTETRFWGIFRCLLLPAGAIGLSLCIFMALATAFGEHAPVIDGREVRGLAGVLICLAAFPFVMLFGASAFAMSLYFDRARARRHMGIAIASGVPGAWNYKQLLAAWGIAFILQSLFLPCLCHIGTAKILFAYSLDVLILLRIGMARLRHETGGGWKFYAWLLCTSPLWIEGIAYLVFGDT